MKSFSAARNVASPAPKLVISKYTSGPIREKSRSIAINAIIQPLTLQILSKSPAFTDLWYESEHNHPNHIQIADSADLFLVAPASANCIALFAQGLAPDLLSTVHLATKAPVLIAPAMNGKMYDHPAMQANIQILRDRNCHFVDPEVGLLACGYEGIGKLAKVETILEKVKELI